MIFGGKKMLKLFFEKLHNFRLLPAFVLVSMAIGITIGKWYGISH
jgi:ACR3 family arsenite transporter